MTALARKLSRARFGWHRAKRSKARGPISSDLFVVRESVSIGRVDLKALERS